VWKPALAELAGALRLAFVIEEFSNGRFTVFVPVGTHTRHRMHLYPRLGRGASTGRTLHSRGQIDFLLGIGLKGTRRSDENREPSESKATKCFKVCPVNCSRQIVNSTISRGETFRHLPSQSYAKKK
jgi:hypothetical protein